jgi:hypothetical protein
MADGTAPVATGNSNAVRLFAENALRRVERVGSLVVVAALALRQQNVEQDSTIADTLDDHAWPEIDEARIQLEALLGTCGEVSNA